MSGIAVGALALVLAASCAPDAPVAQPPEVFVTRTSAVAADLTGILADERAILTILLERECRTVSARFAPDATHVLLVQETDPSLDGYGFTDEKPMVDWWTADGRRTLCPVSLPMLNAFEAGCHVPSTIADGLDLPCPVRIVPRAEVDAFLADRKHGWDRLRAAFCSKGFVSLSPVLFDATRSLALIARGTWSGTMGGGSDLVLFQRCASGWKERAFLRLSYS